MAEMQPPKDRAYYLDICTRFTERLRSVSGVVSIMLVGSLAREKDFFPGWSDIDLLVVVSDGEVKRIIESMVSDFNKGLPPTLKGEQLISLWIDTKDRVHDWLGRGLEYYNFAKNAKLLFGEDMRQGIKEPTRGEMKKQARKAAGYAAAVIADKASHGQPVNGLLAAGLMFPLLRIYFCLNGVPTADRSEIVEETKGVEFFSKEDITTIEELYVRVARLDASPLDSNLARSASNLANKLVLALRGDR